MPIVTALREDGRGRVAVELDDAPWRTIPVVVAAQAGLTEGRSLDRPTLRALRRALRRAEALAVATRTLRSRDMSRARLGERLERAAVPPATAEASLRTLEVAGIVDDERYARARAASMAGRSYGDAAIRLELEAHGLAGDVVEAAIEGLEPEAERAQQVVERRGVGVRTARYLAGKGFCEEACQAALGHDFCN